MDGYSLSRQWFDWSFENPDKVTTNHCALYFFIIELCNRLGWKDKFGLPMEVTKEAIGIKNYRTYKNTLDDLVDWGFITIHQKSKNQYSATVIAIAENTKAKFKALSKAMQIPDINQSQSSVGIVKPINHKPKTFDNNIAQLNFRFIDFWELYDKKVGDKVKIEKVWIKLTEEERSIAMDHIPKYKISTPDKIWRKNPATYLNNKSFNDEIITTNGNNAGFSTKTTVNGKQAGYTMAANNFAIRVSEM
jgi:hypothetical protein